MAKEKWTLDIANVSLAVMANWTPVSSKVVSTMAKPDTEVKGVRAIDFGQGDCNAIIATDGDGDEKPIVFFDIGGGSGQCSHTHRHHPSYGKTGEKGWARIPPRLDTTHNPAVIISHWDKDHYYSATKAVDKVKDLAWIGPRQLVGPQCEKFIGKLTNVKCFPDGHAGVRYQLPAKTGHVDLYIEQADSPGHKDRNLSGLICTLVKHDGGGNDGDKIIMPGDAPYNKIPSMKLVNPPGPKGTVKKLFAYHHGSREHMNHAAAHIPDQPGGGHLLQMTYGLLAGGSNYYGHPHADAVAEYNGKGWTTRANTASTNPTDTDSATNLQDPTTRSDCDVFFS